MIVTSQHILLNPLGATVEFSLQYSALNKTADFVQSPLH